MCESCWIAMGAPAIVTESTRAASQAIARLYEENRVGGALHIVTDDWNLDDESLQWCYDNHVLSATEKAAHTALAPLSEKERASALAIYEKWVAV